ncbi:MAG: radical SAM protein [Chloroflexota bacterium]
MIVTGGDALMRSDVFDFISYGLNKGLIMSLSPSTTALVRPDTLRWLKEAGLSRLSFSLDGARPESHDAFRGIPGSFQRAQECIADAMDAGLSLQINTTITRHSLPELSTLVEMVERSGVAAWDLFFLVPTGRALREDLISPQEHEEVFNWLYDLSQESSLSIRTTLGQPYRRVLLQRQSATNQASPRPAGHGVPSTNDGKGVCFISHVGEIQPSGFLPLSAGNVRSESLVETYRQAPLFQELRDPGLLKGKCGICSFNKVCGGCRARAYAMTGDYLESDPVCIFQPEAQEQPTRGSYAQRAPGP